MKILVTGATGFLGYHFVLRALELGHKIMCLKRSLSIDKFSAEISKKIDWVEDSDNLKSQVDTFAPTVLMHAAWEGVRGSGRDLSDIQHNNIIMSKRIFELYPYEHIISIGSQAEYGFYNHLVSENDPVFPDTEYGRAKDECRKWLQNYCTKKKIEWQWIRIFTVFGEKQTGGLIQAFANACRINQREFLTTEGMQRYSYLYSSDFATALCHILGERGKSGIYNLSQPQDIYSNREILDKIKNMLHSDIQISYGAIPYSNNQIMLMDGNIEKFESNFGKIPHTDFDSALKSTLMSN